MLVSRSEEALYGAILLYRKAKKFGVEAMGIGGLFFFCQNFKCKASVNICY